jgi:hypothetical protein
MFVILMSSVVLIGCSSNTTKDIYETNADFTNLNTFDWFVVPQEMQLNEVVVKGIKDAVTRQLTAKGLRITPEDPSFLIAWHVSKQVKKDSWSFTDARYGSYRTRFPRAYEVGTLILDFVDPGTKELLWRGSATSVIKSNITPEEQKTMINEAVSRILDKFPPVP